MAEFVHAWITKYALTQGIYDADVKPSESGYAYQHNGPYQTQYCPGDWHVTEEAARRRARQMITAKLASIDKQRAKLMKLLAEYGETAKEAGA